MEQANHAVEIEPVSPAPPAASNGWNERFEEVRHFLRWLAHFIVNGFVAGVMLLLLILPELTERFSEGLERQFYSDMSVRVVLNADVTLDRAKELALTFVGKNKDNVSFQVITPEQGRTLMAIDESWTKDLMPVATDQLPSVIEISQLRDKAPVNLTHIARLAKDSLEVSAVLYNETAWKEANIIARELGKVSTFPRYILQMLVPLTIALCCLFSGIGLRHRRFWLVPFGVTIATIVCVLTIVLLTHGITILMLGNEGTSETIKMMLKAHALSVPIPYFVYLVGFWFLIELFRLRRN